VYLSRRTQEWEEADFAAVAVLAEAASGAEWAAIAAEWAATAADLLEGGGAAVVGRVPAGGVAIVDMDIEEATADTATADTDIPWWVPRSVLASATQLRPIRMVTAMVVAMAIQAAAPADIERSKTFKGDYF
jgi:hypothetical protein